MTNSDKYIGLDNDLNGGMTAMGKLIRDAKVFGVIDDAETCEGWELSRIYALQDDVNKEWDTYGCLVSNLPEDLFKRHQEIHKNAMTEARASGWSGEDEL